MEKHSLQRTSRSFSTNVVVVLIISLLVIELASFWGGSQSVASAFQDPVSRILSGGYLILGLVGILTLLRKNWLGPYLAVLSSVFTLVLGCFSALRAFEAVPLNGGLMASAGTAIVLGTGILVSSFKISGTQLARADKGHRLERERYVIEAENVTKRYVLGSNVVSAVEDLSMTVRKGDYLAIMGPSGSGKSTLLNLIGALDRPTSGRVLIDGVDVATLDDQSLARLRNEKIGFVFQSYNLVARSSVLRNMELPALVKGSPKEDRVRRVSNLLTVVGLGDKISRKPKTLSGGEQQRVAIARALINDPEIILADEPTGNVDSKQGKEIMSFLRQLNVEKGTTVICVTHDPEVAEMADKIIHIRDGKIIRK